MGISDAPQLSGFDEDFSSNIYNQVYHGLPGFDDFSSDIYNQVYHTAAQPCERYFIAFIQRTTCFSQRKL